MFTGGGSVFSEESLSAVGCQRRGLKMDVLGYSGGRNEKEKSRGTGSELLAAEVPCVELVVPRASAQGQIQKDADRKTERKKGRRL